MKLMRPPARPRHNPLLAVKLDNPKYTAWRAFLNGASVSLDFHEN